MKTINSIKSVILVAIVAAVGVNVSTSVSASTTQYAPRNATESVFFSHGYVEAYAEGEDLYNRGVAEANSQGQSIANLATRISFRTMAANNGTVLRSFAQANSTGQYNPIIAYLSGRVAAFLALAEIYGE